MRPSVDMMAARRVGNFVVAEKSASIFQGRQPRFDAQGEGDIQTRDDEGVESTGTRAVHARTLCGLRRRRGRFGRAAGG